MKSPKVIHKLLGSANSELESLITRARQREHYNSSLQAHLPPPLDQHCVLMDIQANTLIVGVDKAAWGTKLRLLSNAIVATLRQQFPEFASLEHITVQVIVPAPVSPPLAPQPMPPLSAENAALLQALAGSVENLPLRAALLRLAAHTK
ncbi:MAG: DUF721 domain-containing protein [Gammaproteobacteria bacterium]|nr:DUF721 domain-containing protein [Gammaproteobacteria bacterium]